MVRQSLAGSFSPKGQTMASDKNLWLGILQDAATDLNAIIDEISTGYLIYQNIDEGMRHELEYLCHRINETRDGIVKANEPEPEFVADAFKEFRHSKHEVL